MFVNTHTLIAKSIVNNIDENKHFFLNENHFIYGNIKPDLSSKYFFKKHYLKESYDMIESKVNYLCNLNLNSLSKYFSVGVLSQELGVICHFLCDFLCVPHSYRWEFKHSMKKHLSYETELNTVAKETNLNKFINDDIKYDSFGEFFNSLYIEYQQILDHKNDLLFSVYASSITYFQSILIPRAFTKKYVLSLTSSKILGINPSVFSLIQLLILSVLSNES